MVMLISTSLPEGSVAAVPAKFPSSVILTAPVPRNPSPSTVVIEPLTPDVGASQRSGAGCARPGTATRRPTRTMSANVASAREGMRFRPMCSPEDYEGQARSQGTVDTQPHYLQHESPRRDWFGHEQRRDRPGRRGSPTRARGGSRAPERRTDGVTRAGRGRAQGFPTTS